MQTRQMDEIKHYQLKHEGGMFYLYVNDTADKILRETQEFEMTGLEVEGQKSRAGDNG